MIHDYSMSNFHSILTSHCVKMNMTSWTFCIYICCITVTNWFLEIESLLLCNVGRRRGCCWCTTSPLTPPSGRSPTITWVGSNFFFTNHRPGFKDYSALPFVIGGELAKLSWIDDKLWQLDVGRLDELYTIRLRGQGYIFYLLKSPSTTYRGYFVFSVKLSEIWREIWKLKIDYKAKK